MAGAGRGSQSRVQLVEDDAVFRLSSLGRYPHLVFAVTRRRAPGLCDGSDFSLRAAGEEDREIVAARRAQVAEHLGIELDRTVWLDPTPSVPVEWVADDEAYPAHAEDCGTRLHRGAGLVTASLNFYLCGLCNDNALVLIYDTRWYAAGLVSVDPVEPSAAPLFQTLDLMKERIGTRPDDVVAVIAPSVGPCCHTFEDASLSTIQGRTNLWDVARAALLSSGVPYDRVLNPRVCTACRDTEFFSRLIEGPGCGAGAVIAGVKDEEGSLAQTLAARRARETSRGESAATEAGHEEYDPSLTEAEHRLNRAMKCPYGHNKVYIRSLVDGSGASEPEIALRCAIIAYVKQAAAGYNVVPRDFVERICCGDYKRCKAYQEFTKRNKR